MSISLLGCLERSSPLFDISKFGQWDLHELEHHYTIWGTPEKPSAFMKRNTLEAQNRAQENIERQERERQRQQLAA